MRIFYLRELTVFLDEFKFETLNVYENFEQDRFRKNAGKILPVIKEKS